MSAHRPTFYERLFRGRFLTEARRLELYPPFFLMRIKVLAIEDSWRRVRIRLPLNAFSRNLGGGMFGGYQASLADPIAALACAKVFPDYSVWTRRLVVDFEHAAHGDLELRFDFDPAQEAAIAAELARDGRATPTFELGYYGADGVRTTLVHNTVAIRQRGYRKAR